ncbi:prepilin peptidase [Ovoidimarina sediminis]|uniref:prepilin peptidase n=1 Tax=Ovoidimarina sediminis TaxID=3079856 RepID=UPI00290C77F6|nr:prepilin peptidase [Rhodophyticola sp. MJ-SS7]MDU8946035.1 prepilin peptidase [Rhodophyticola sp. MJ-SS7]
MELIPLLLLAPLLVFVAFFDMRLMRIPNWISLAGLAIFVLTMPLLPGSEIVARLMMAAIVFVLGIGAFMMRWFGGGDIKILSVLFLFIPSGTLSLYGLGFSASMLAGIALILTLRTIPWPANTEWVSLRETGTFPMGISIALSGIIHPYVVQAFG